MANPWSIAATGWAVVVVGWLLSPIINWLLQNLFAYLIFDASKELPELELDTIPALKLTLREVEEQRMLRAAREDEGPRSDLEILDKMDMRLKSALCQAEDILDLVDYHQIEKKLIGNGTSWVKRLITAAVACFARCCRWIRVTAQGLLHTAGAWMAGRWGTLIQRCTDITPAPLLQFVHSMKQKLGQLFGGIISLWSSGTLLPVSQATSTVGVQRLCGWCSQIVANITSCYRSLLSWCTDRIADARYYRDWSYEQVSFKINEQVPYYLIRSLCQIP
jgi:hypothetical protein